MDTTTKLAVYRHEVTSVFGGGFRRIARYTGVDYAVRSFKRRRSDNANSDRPRSYRGPEELRER